MVKYYLDPYYPESLIRDDDEEDYDICIDEGIYKNEEICNYEDSDENCEKKCLKKIIETTRPEYHTLDTLKTCIKDDSLFKEIEDQSHYKSTLNRYSKNNLLERYLLLIYYQSISIYKSKVFLLLRKSY